MRASRSTLAGTAIALLLAASAVPAVGQEATDALVTGTLDCWMAGDPTTQEDDTLQLNVRAIRCAAEMSDPRVSGILDSDLQEVCFKEAGPRVCMRHGMTTLEGPDGTWVGEWDTMSDASSVRLPAWVSMQGTGPYEGWTYWLFTANHWDPATEASGIVYEGPPPPWGDSLPLTPAE